MSTKKSLRGFCGVLFALEGARMQKDLEKIRCANIELLTEKNLRE